MSNSRFLELRDEHGRDHQGNLEPLAEIGLSIPRPSTVNGDVTIIGDAGATRVAIAPAPSLDKVKDDDHGKLPARVIPDTRIVETTNDLIADTLLAGGLFVEIDEPKKAKIDKAVSETKAHIAAMADRDKQVQSGNEPAPDATDQPAVVGEEE